MPTLRRLWLNLDEIGMIDAVAFAGLTELEYSNISNGPLERALPESVCTFLEGVEVVVSDGVDIDALCSN